VSTYDASAFRTQERDDGKTNIYFNGPGDGPNHGHVVQHPDADGNMVYDFVRDVEGNTYIDNG
jgi:predicted phage tail protein